MLENLKKFNDFDLVRVKIKEISLFAPEVWNIQLTDDNGQINILADIGQVTHILFGLSKTSSIALSPSSYHLVSDLCKYSGLKISSVIIDSVEEVFSTAKIECKKGKDSLYFSISSGDAIVFALLNRVPIYTLKNLLEEIDGDELDFIIEH